VNLKEVVVAKAEIESPTRRFLAFQFAAPAVP
jgi:hypothetical protein